MTKQRDVERDAVELAKKGQQKLKVRIKTIRKAGSVSSGSLITQTIKQQCQLPKDLLMRQLADQLLLHHTISVKQPSSLRVANSPLPAVMRNCPRVRILEIEFYRNDGQAHPDTFAEVFQKHCNYSNRKQSWLLIADALAYRYSKDFFVLIKSVAIPRSDSYVMISGACNVARFMQLRIDLLQDAADNFDNLLSLTKMELGDVADDGPLMRK